MFVPVTVLFVIQKIVFVVNIQINTPSGKLLGSTLTSRLGKTIYSFRGIRFAEPPVGELRFKPPVPIEKWTGVYNATLDGSACPQPGTSGLTVPTSEDCLFLNVYTTKLPNSTNSNENRPVIIFIFPGGFTQGAGSSDIAGPQYLMDQEVVLVTLNHRLAALGFLAVGREVPGNNGLKDQVVAMRWTKNNIAAFGGDPDSITLYGYSSGGACVTGHLVSPMSRGLFHKAIFSSYSLFGIFPFPTNLLNLAKKQARFVGCPEDTTENIVSCLKTKSAEEIAETLPKFREFGDDPVLTWTPVIEEDYGQERFLTEHPIKSVVEGNFAKVPIIAGLTRDESAIRALSITLNPNLTTELNQKWEKYAPIAFCYERDTNRSKYISRSVREFYLNNQPVSLLTSFALGEIYADALTGFAVNRAVELLAEKSNSRVYYYLFTLGFLPFGVFHGKDYLYMFKVSSLSQVSNLTGFPDSKTIDRLTTFWANFAKTSDPTYDSNATLKWEPFNNATKKYLDIGKTLNTKSHLFQRRYNFWKELFPISGYL